MAQPNPLDRLSEAIEQSIFNNLKSLYIARIKKLEPPNASLQPLSQPDGDKQNEVSSASFMIVPLYYKLPKVDEIKGILKNKDDKEDIISAYQKVLDAKPFYKPKLDYEEGDNVIVGVFDHDNQNYDPDDGSEFNSSGNRTHAIDYSIVLGRYATADDFKKD